MKSENQKTVEAARKITENDPWLKMAWRNAWVRVCDRLEPIYKARRPVMKSFEVHHCNETARAAFLKAAVAGTPLKECEEISFKAVDTQ